MSYDSTILAESNLIAYYELNETSGTTAHDATSNHYDGTLHGTITLNQTKLDVGLGPCMLFDGSTGYITLPSGVQIVEPITIEAWIKPTSLPALGAIVYGTWDNRSGFFNGYEFGINDNPPTDFFVALNGGNTHGGSAFSNNTVYYCAYTVDTGQNATGYTGPVGGSVTQQTTGNPGGSLAYGSTVPQIGARWNNTGPTIFFPGCISSLAIYGKLLTTTIMNNHIAVAHTNAARLRISDGYGGVFS